MGTYALFGGLVVLGGVILSAVGSARAANDKTSEVFNASELSGGCLVPAKGG